MCPKRRVKSDFQKQKIQRGDNFDVRTIEIFFSTFQNKIIFLKSGLNGTQKILKEDKAKRPNIG